MHPEMARRHRGSMNLNTSAAFVRSFKIKYGSAGEVRIAARTLVEAVRAKDRADVALTRADREVPRQK